MIATDTPMYMGTDQDTAPTTAASDQSIFPPQQLWQVPDAAQELVVIVLLAEEDEDLFPTANFPDPTRLDVVLSHAFPQASQVTSR